MVLVTGAAGRLGSRVSEKLLAEGRRVRVLTRTQVATERLERLGAEVMVGDLHDAASARLACGGVDYVVAATQSLDGMGNDEPYTVEEAGTRQLIAAAREARVKHFVYVSALGAEPGHRLACYRCKHAIEERVRASGLSYTVLRPPPVMETWVARLGQPILERGTTVILGSGECLINLMALDDVAHYVLVALFNPDARDRVIEIGGPENLTQLQVVEALERACGRKARCTHVPLWLLRAVSVLVGPFDAGTSQACAMRVHCSSCDQTFDPAALLAEFPWRLTKLDELARDVSRASHADAGERARW